MRRGGLASSALLLVAGCAAPKALLLPGEDGHVGALAVLNADGSEQVLDTPLRSARMSGRRTSVRTEKTLKPAYGRLLSNMPPPERSFTLEFEQDTTRITAASRPVLDQIRAEVARRPGAEVQVTGHTDTVGTDDYNDALSMRRATEVMRWLEEEGFPRDMLSAVGRGEREPKVDAGDEMSVRENRRVEVIVR